MMQLPLACCLTCHKYCREGIRTSRSGVLPASISGKQLIFLEEHFGIGDLRSDAFPDLQFQFFSASARNKSLHQMIVGDSYDDMRQLDAEYH